MNIKKISVDLNKFDASKESFLMLREASNYYVLHDLYHFYDYAENHLFSSYIAHIKEIKLSEIENDVSFLMENTTSKIYKEILYSYGYKDESLLYVMTFTNQKLENYEL
mgnify:CR=1 FL=1